MLTNKNIIILIYCYITITNSQKTRTSFYVGVLKVVTWNIFCISSLR